jgi:hypothetical protein
MLSLLEIPLVKSRLFRKVTFQPSFRQCSRIRPLPWNLLLDLFHESSYAAMHMLPRDLFLLLNHSLVTYNSQRSLKILEHILGM